MRYPEQSTSLFDKKWTRHQIPVPVVARSGSYPSVVEQTTQHFPYLPVHNDILP
jgi:hypothetical protein